MGGFKLTSRGILVLLILLIGGIIGLAILFGPQAIVAWDNFQATETAKDATQQAIEAMVPPTLEPFQYEATAVAIVVEEPEDQPMVDPADGNPVVKIGVDAFAPYYIPMLAKALVLDGKYGIDMEFITFYSDDSTSFDETGRSEMLTSGEWDILFTTLDKLALRPEIGQLIFFTDETDGADKLVCNDSVRTINDLRGKRIAVLSESIGEFAVYWYIDLVKILPTEVVIVANYDGVATYNEDGEVDGGAVWEFINGNVDCVSGWEPDVDEAFDYGGRVLIDTSDIRVALDVVLASNNAVDSRSDETQAFINAYAEALKILLEQPDYAELVLIEWLYANQLEDWAFIWEPGDWLGWLETTPQATLADNAFVFRNETPISERMADNCRVWAHAGFETPAACSADFYLNVINPSFVQGATTVGEIASTASPVNDSFLFTSHVDIPEITLEEVEAGEVLATLPFEKIPFLPNDYTLTPGGISQLDENVCPVMQTSSGLILKLTGSAALPVDDVERGIYYTLEGSVDFARKRALSVLSHLSISIDNEGCGIDPDRIIVTTVEPAHPRDSANLELDRYVKFELVSVGY